MDPTGLDFEGSPTINVTLGANDAASAKKLEELAEQARELGRQFVAAQIAQMEAESEDATQQAMAKYLRRLSTKLLDDIEI